MGDLKGHPGVLLDEDNRCPLLFVDPAYDSEDLLDNERGKSQGWFVEKKQFRMGHQGASHYEHLQLTAATVTGKPSAPLPECGKVTIYPLKILVPGFAPSGCRSDPEVFFNGQILERLPPLEHLDDSVPGDGFRRLVLDLAVLVKDRTVRDFAVFRFQEPGNRLQGCRLACAVAPQQGYDAVLLHGQRHALKHLDNVGIDDGYVVQLQKCSVHEPILQ